MTFTKPPDFSDQEGAERLLQLVSEPAIPAALDGGPLKLRSVATAIANPPLEPPVLVEGMLRAGELCVIGAPRAIGKSWAGMNLAYLVASGEGNFMGTLPVRSSVPVLYLQGELMEWNSARRWAMLVADESPPANLAETFEPLRFQVERVTEEKVSPNGKRDRTEHFKGTLDPRLEQVIAEHRIGLLVIDPWAVYLAGDENSNGEVEAVLSELRQLALKYCTAIVIFHHFKKLSESRDIEDNWRGASRLADWASTRVTIFPHPFTDSELVELGVPDEEARRYVDVYFLRRDEPTAPFSAHLDKTGWWGRWEAPKRDVTVALARKETVHVDNVLVKLNADGAWISRQQAQDQLTSTGAKAKDARTALHQAVKEGLVVLRPFGHKTIYYVSDVGRERLSSQGVPMRTHPYETLSRMGFTSAEVEHLLKDVTEVGEQGAS